MTASSMRMTDGSDSQRHSSMTWPWLSFYKKGFSSCSSPIINSNHSSLIIPRSNLRTNFQTPCNSSASSWLLEPSPQPQLLLQAALSSVGQEASSLAMPQISPTPKVVSSFIPKLDSAVSWVRPPQDSPLIQSPRDVSIRLRRFHQQYRPRQ